MDLSREQAFAVGLAELAAGVSLPAFGGRQRVEHKHDGTPVTETDHAIEDALRAAIEVAFPVDGVLGEERGRSGPPTAGRVWTLDPIDGTKNFADGVALWSTLIALVVDGVPVLGLVDVPAIGERYAAVQGHGATRNGIPIHVSAVATLADAVVGHSGLEEWRPGPEREGLLRVVDGCRRTRGLSDGWGHMQVAAGALDACLEHDPCGEWDWAPAVTIVGEAGGRVTALDGTPVAPQCDLLVSNGHLHDAVRSIL